MASAVAAMRSSRAQTSKRPDEDAMEIDVSEQLNGHVNGEDEDSEEFEADEEEVDQAPKKDATEMELEKLVFGDSAGFREALSEFQHDPTDSEDESEAHEQSQGEETAYDTLKDTDLFFLDSEPSADKQQLLASASDKGVVDPREAPAWEDSDDERLMVSLMAVPRLRKLREFEGEDVISGKDYIQRLRRQFELLHPRPTWTNWDPDKKRARKRRKQYHRTQDGVAGSRDTSSSGSDSDDNPQHDPYRSDEGEPSLSTQPLAELLRSTTPLTRLSNSSARQGLRLRPEVIDIDRIKDIAPVQPHAITSLSIHPTLPLILSSGISSTLYLHYLHPRPTPPDPANPMVTSLHLKHTPLTTTAFSAPTAGWGDSANEQPKIYLSGRRRYFHVWDLPTGEISKVTRVYGNQESQQSMEILKPSPCGRWVALQGSSRKGGGIINVLDAHTLQWTCQARVEGRHGIADFAWWADGNALSIASRGGEVTEWSVIERRVLARWQDEGAVGITVLALSGAGQGKMIASTGAGKSAGKSVSALGPDRYVAIGSSSGIVNLYDRTQLQSLPISNTAATNGYGSNSLSSVGPGPGPGPGAGSEVPVQKPARVFENLTTSIAHLAFSPCGQLLAMSSRAKKDALRLVHVPSRSVYRNWPTSKTPLGRVSALCIGEYEDPGADKGADGPRGSLVLCVGNEAGALRAWEITA